MSEFQEYPIIDMHTALIAGAGSFGTFICSEANPFDASLLTDQNKGKVGYAVQLVSKAGTPVTVASITTNGVIGDVAALAGAWPAGQGFAIEITAMTMAAGDNYAVILLKKASDINP